MPPRKIHSGPWLVPAAIAFMETLLTKDSVVFETGAGGSTLWFAARCLKVLTAEHDAAWHALIAAEVKKRGLKNVHLALVAGYPAAGHDLDPDAFDFVLVDGRGRVKTIETIWKSLKPGGWIGLDNSERPRYEAGKGFLDRHSSSKAVFSAEWETTFWQKRAEAAHA